MRKLMYILMFMVSLSSLGQSQDQNYIKSTIYKKATSVENVNPSLPSDAIVTINYLDGLGRLMQNVRHKQSATGKDIVVPVIYDDLGRQTKDYLPFPVATANMEFIPNSTVISDPTSYYTNSYGSDGMYTSANRVLEASPLGRLLKQGNVGEDWSIASGSNSDHTIKFDYLTNTLNEVRLYTAFSTWMPDIGLFQSAIRRPDLLVYHPPSRLYKTITKDENWISGLLHTTEEFKSKDGKVILKRTYNLIDNIISPHDTYYIYDQFDNLAYVIPPLANGNVTDGVLNNLGYQYKYDARNRMVEKKLPGKQWEFIVYDKLDRVVAMGPTLSPFTDYTFPNNSGWIITKYDKFNRKIITGWKYSTLISSTGRKNLQDEYNASSTYSETRNTIVSTVNGVACLYSNLALPVSDYHILNIQYYDSYQNISWMPSTLPATSLGNPVFYNNTVKPQGLLVASWIRLLESSNLYRNEASYILYDYNSRPIINYKRNHLGGSSTVFTKHNFAGEVLTSQIVHKYLATSTELVVNDNLSYSDQGKVLLHKHRINSMPEQLMSLNDYNELGQLKSKKVGGSDFSGNYFYQKVDFSYNIHGWLMGINNVADLNQDSDPTDLFAFKINYNEIAGEVENITPLYNGNISETYWRTDNDNTIRKYGYAYDHLNRLKDAVYQKPDPDDLSVNLITTNSYRENLSYDKNGNIQHLLRNGAYDDALYELTIDDLDYEYFSGTNRLQNVVDLSLSSEGFKDGIQEIDDYTYDNIGNLLSDANKGISKITYNHLNFPIEILFANGSKIAYTYNAEGLKVEKKIVVGNHVSLTQYIDDFHYFNSQLQFFPTSEGYVRVTETSEGRHGAIETYYNYAFNFTDHLGNVRLTYGYADGFQQLVKMEENNYYPFGLKHNNYNWSRSDYLIYQEGQSPEIGPILANYVANNYRYLGQERQDELGLNWDTFRYRNYDYTIGRFFGVDPITEKYMSISPYQFAHNNPIWKVEIEGLEGIAKSGVDIINGETVQIEQTEYVTPDGRRGTMTVSVSANLHDRLPETDENSGNGGEPSEFSNFDWGGSSTYDPIFDPPEGFSPLYATTEMLIAHDVYQLGDLAMGLGGVAGAGKKLIKEALEKAAKDGPQAVENIGGILKSSNSAIKGIDAQIAKHTKKLKEYIANPDAGDNKGFLKNVSPELRDKIIKKRIESLEHQLNNFQSQKDDILDGIEKLLNQLNSQ